MNSEAVTQAGFQRLPKLPKDTKVRSEMKLKTTNEESCHLCFHYFQPVSREREEKPPLDKDALSLPIFSHQPDEVVKVGVV